ncbi:zinc ribbon domain-containing protein [Anaeromicrobium sediminis]|uniref:Transcriptional regulator n=1 Tax=Anaeromicrobium sediminis TaxID=1478221 RepID=A0A267MK17_9FIRM|nr:zinc ribbon domain-containing protein [Anaeromicrobium sediminis]PAB59130.1 transcriptional regulator [Anaeromicrobium sediminis]
MNMRLCQSCAMPLNDENLLGTNKDSSKNEEYCIYCLQKGEYTANITMDEMINVCVPHMMKEGYGEEKARGMLNELLPKLKRWKK